MAALTGPSARGYEAKTASPEEKVAAAAAKPSSQPQAKPDLTKLVTDASKDAIAALKKLCDTEFVWYDIAVSRKAVPSTGVVTLTCGKTIFGFRPAEVFKSAPADLMEELTTLNKTNQKVYKIWTLISRICADTMCAEAKKFFTTHLMLSYCHKTYFETSKAQPLVDFYHSPVFSKVMLEHAKEVAKKI